MATSIQDAVAGVLSRDALLGGGVYWRDKRFDPSVDNPTYIGWHSVHNVGEDDPNWAIFKLSGTNVTRIELLTGKWSLRDSLAWG